MYKIAVICALFAVATAVPVFKVGSQVFETEHDALFHKFKTQHGKVYFDSHDESTRKAIFVKNHERINAHNLEAEQGKHKYTLAMNEFGDLEWEEFHAKYTGFLGLRHEYLRSMNTQDLSHVKVEESIDWVAKGAVTPVKNQGQCGSCWSFSTTGAIEGAHFIKTGELVSLSEQELMDCSSTEGNHSCEGGLMDYAFEWVIKKGGLCAESAYPYLEKDESTCSASTCAVKATISSYKDVEQTESALMAAANMGPVSIAIEADQSAFQFYSSGVLTAACGTNLDHGVLLVGYGTEDGTDYWKVKNSWGPTWGLDGYILLERGIAQSGGECGILEAASYPVV